MGRFWMMGWGAGGVDGDVSAWAERFSCRAIRFQPLMKLSTLKAAIVTFAPPVNFLGVRFFRCSVMVVFPLLLFAMDAFIILTGDDESMN
ncbi:MAG: hypothetical protein D6784_06735 [Chloroflexi bacterium]|nr:MAG: hypothetical protein D6784_06735 [Chloroflexota bacterium]